MHRHLTPQQWALAFGDPNDVSGLELVACPRCSPYRGNLEAWLGAIDQCPDCAAALETYDPLPVEVLECDECMAAYEVFDGWLEAVEHFEPHVAPEWVTALDLLEELARLPLGEQIVQVRSQPVYQQWGLCQRLLAESFEARLTDPRRCHDRAALAAAVADRLDEEEYQARWVAELRAKAHAYYGNALRLLGSYGEAEREFALAETWLGRGLGRGRGEARVLSLKASLLLDQYRNLEAEALLERVERHYRVNRQRVEAAKALLKLAMVSRARELPQEAAERAERALDVLDLEDEPVLQVVARHNLVNYLLDSGDLRQARLVFDELPETADRLLRLRRTWLEGDLLRAEGDLDGAARRYDETRVGYLAEGLHYSVALASLSLAMVAAEQERHDAVRELARDAVVLLTRAGAPQEAFAAIRLLVDTLERQAVTVAFIDQIARQLVRLQPSK